VVLQLGGLGVRLKLTVNISLLRKFMRQYWVLRRIFGPKRDEMTGDWRELHNEELHNLYSSPN
jgi:hypothetical protein